MDSEAEALDAEVRELLSNYRNARRSSREPCATENYTQCLAALQEELNILNVRYVFNPYADVCEATRSLRPPALAALINAAFTLLHEHKRLARSASALTQSNHELEKNNAYLNSKVERLTAEAQRAERERRACAAEGLRAAEAAAAARGELRQARARLARLATGAAAAEHALRVQNARLQKENLHLQDKFRDKCGTFLSTSDAREGPQQLSQRERALKETVGELRRHNRRLLGEVLALKEDLLVQSLGSAQLT